MRARLLPAGEAAVLVEVEDSGAVATLAEALAGWTPGRAVLDLVPGARTVLVAFADPAAATGHSASLTALLAGLATRPPVAEPGRTVVVPVVYDGPDLAEVAALTGLGADEVVAAHTGTPWRVAFGGFAPGFAYLAGGDPRLRVPRRAQPRPAVPAGAVGLAGEFSGVYPRASPGGWQLLGRTTLVLWDQAADPPALLRPGWWVRFEAAG
jgi:KipI family sensor histidine kinase inhibitor